MIPPCDDLRTRMLRVIQYVEDRLDQNLTLEDLAAQACFSPFHFHRVFSAFAGEAPLEYFRRLRLERAALALVYHRDRKIIDIALDHGFRSPEVFTRAFQRRWGVTPGQHRRSPGTTVQGTALLPPPREPPDLELGIVRRGAAEGLALRSWNGYGPHLFGLWDTLCAQAEALGLRDGTAQYWGLSLDDPLLTPADKCRYVACLVPGNGKGLPPVLEGGLTRYRLQPGTYLRLAFSGGAAELFNAYRWIFCVWINGQPWEPANRPPLELYLGTGTAPERTALHIPLVRRD